MQTQMQNQKSKIQSAFGTRQAVATVSSLPRFVVTLNADAVPRGAIRVPLAVTGKWVRGTTTFTITREDLEAIVRNFRERQNGEINIDYDHASEMPEVAAGGPIPSAGRIVRLDPPESVGAAPRGRPGQAQGPAPMNDRFILYGWFEPTARARELLKNREYRFISPAIEWGAKSKRNGKPQGTTLTSAALTNRPFLEELPQIRLSDPRWQACQSDPPTGGEESAVLTADPSSVSRRTQGDRQRGTETRYRAPASRPCATEKRGERRALQGGGKPPHSQGGSMKTVSLSVENGTLRLMHEDFQEAYCLSSDDLHSCLSEQGLLAVEPGQATTLSFAQARALLSEDDARGKFIPAAEVFRAHAEQELEEGVRTGRILPRQRDEWRRIALSDLPTFRRLMAAQRPVVPLAPVGFAGTPPSDVQAHVKFLAEQRMRERQVSFGQALSDIGREQPDLVQQYRRAVSNNE